MGLTSDDSVHCNPLLVLNSSVAHRQTVEGRASSARRVASATRRLRDGSSRVEAEAREVGAWEKWAREQGITAACNAGGHGPQSNSFTSHTRAHERREGPKAKAQLRIVDSYSRADVIQQYYPPIATHQQLQLRRNVVNGARAATTTSSNPLIQHQEGSGGATADDSRTHSCSLVRGSSPTMSLSPAVKLLQGGGDKEEDCGASKVIYFPSRKTARALANTESRAEGLQWPSIQGPIRRFSHAAPVSPRMMKVEHSCQPIGHQVRLSVGLNAASHVAENHTSSRQIDARDAGCSAFVRPVPLSPRAPAGGAGPSSRKARRKVPSCPQGVFVDAMKQMYKLPERGPRTSSRGEAGQGCELDLGAMNPAFEYGYGGSSGSVGEEGGSGVVYLQRGRSRERPVGSPSGWGARPGSSTDAFPARSACRVSADTGTLMLADGGEQILEARAVHLHTPTRDQVVPEPDRPQANAGRVEEAQVVKGVDEGRARPPSCPPPATDTESELRGRGASSATGPPPPSQSPPATKVENNWRGRGAFSVSESRLPSFLPPAAETASDWRGRGAFLVSEPPRGRTPPHKDTLRAPLQSRGTHPGDVATLRAVPRSSHDKTEERKRTSCPPSYGRPTWGGGWVYGMGGAERARDEGRPAVKSRLKTGDFACERHAERQCFVDERLAAIHAAPMSAWADDETTWVAIPEEAESPAFDAPSAGASCHRRYLYKDIISVVPSPEELEAMRRAHAEMAEGTSRGSTGGSSSRRTSSHSNTGSAFDTPTTSDNSDTDGDP